MKLKELLPLIECSTVNVYEKRRYGPPRFIVLINPKKNKGCISDDLLDRDIRSISISYRDGFNICVCKKKDDEELVEKAASIGLIEDVNNDDSNEEDFQMTVKQRKLIESMNEFCDEKIDISKIRNNKEISEYISRNIEQYKLRISNERLMNEGYF